MWYEQINIKIKYERTHGILMGSFPYLLCYIYLKILNEQAKNSKMSLLKFLYVNW